MLSLGNVVYCRSLLEPVGGEGGEVGELGIGLAVCAWILWSKGAGEIFRACMLSFGECCLLPLLAGAGGELCGGEVGGGVRYRAGGVCVYPLGQRGWGNF